MGNDFYRVFNSAVDEYRKALLREARKCKWAAFEVLAGRLFDYVESVEMFVMERKFFRIFCAVMLGLFFLVLIIFKVDFSSTPHRIRELAIIAAISGTCFEFFFFFNFRVYKGNKVKFYNDRRATFIRNIEKDFKWEILPHCPEEQQIYVTAEEGTSGRHGGPVTISE